MENKKTKIPGIFIGFIIIVLCIFSGLTFAVASKLSDSNLALSHTGLTNLIKSFEKNTLINDGGTDEKDSENYELVLEDTELSPSPVISEEPTTSPLLTSRPINTKHPIPSPLITPLLTNTPAPTLTPKVDKPDICSVKLRYRVSYIDDQFRQNDFDQDNLKNLALYSEKQWESALGHDIFQYDEWSFNANSINFVQDVPMPIGNYEAGQLSQTRKSAFDENKIIKEFEIELFSGIFNLLENDSDTLKEGSAQYKLVESGITRAIMHQMGHVLGLEHLSKDDSGIMSTKWTLTNTKPVLTQNDLDLLKNICD